MGTEVKVPTLGESVTEATIGEWLKKPGEAVALDEPIASLETDKVAVEVPAPVAGLMGDYAVAVGDTVEVGAVIAVIEEGQVQAGPEATRPRDEADAIDRAESEPAGEPEDAASASLAGEEATGDQAQTLSPAVRRAVLEHGIDPSQVKGSGKDGRLTKEDVLAAAKAKDSAPTPAARQEAPGPAPAPAPSGERRTERVKMTRLRQTIAKRLKSAQEEAALLTTFNDCDMSAVIAAREAYKDVFAKKHGIKLGFMSFFAKAAVPGAEGRARSVNAQIDGDEIVYHDFVDISVGGERAERPGGARGPQCADAMSFAQIEQAIADFGQKAKDGALTMEDMKRRHLHHLQRRRVRLVDVDPDHQPAASRRAGIAPDRGPPGGSRRRSGGAPDDVPGALLRPPPDRRARGGDRIEDHQGGDRGSDAVADRLVSST